MKLPRLYIDRYVSKQALHLFDIRAYPVPWFTELWLSVDKRGLYIHNNMFGQLGPYAIYWAFRWNPIGFFVRKPHRY